MLLPQHIVCIQYVILLFLFCQQRLLLRTIKEIKCTLPTRKNGTLCRFYYGLFTHNENAKSSNFNRNYFMGATSVQRRYILILKGVQPQLYEVQLLPIELLFRKKYSCAMLYKLKLSISVTIPLHNLFHR